MIKVTFPDGNVKEFQKGISGYEIAKGISQRLADEVLSVSINGSVQSLNTPISENCTIKLHKWDDKEAQSTFWHSSSHLMAEAIAALYPKVKFGFGPSIDNGFYYDVDFQVAGVMISENDFPKIEKKMIELASQKQSFAREEVTKQEALKYFWDKGENYKVELINDLEDGKITFYKSGDFTDLCKGPHISNTELIKAVKLLSVAGAYWRGNEKNKQLTRIYGISFPKQKMLDEYLEKLELAKLRDHRKIGKELELFTFSKAVGMGLPLWLPRGAQLRQRLEDFLKRVQRIYQYEQVITPHIGDVNLYKTSGHFQKYGQDSFQPISTPEEGEQFMLKPMNCPHHCEIYNWKPRSYKDLPIRLAEFGTVYRYEQHGELHGLTRVRSFTQDDAHIFCTPDQLKEEFKKVIDIIFIIFKSLNFTEYSAQISLRDPNNKEKYIGTDENWAKAEKSIIEASSEKGLKTVTKIGEAAFYGPKLDFMVKDAIGRSWQLGTVQIDYNLPERFNLEYIGADNQKHQPIMIHRAPFGSMERFVAVLIEHSAGKFPLWLTPDQVVVLPISEKFNNFAKEVANKLNILDIRTQIDDRNEKIGKKIRDNELKRIPYILVVGEKEVENQVVAVRRQGEGDKGQMSVEEFVNLVKKQIDEELSLINNIKI